MKKLAIVLGSALVILVAGRMLLPGGANGIAVDPPTNPDYCTDCNGDGKVDISDAVCILNYLFLGAEPPYCIAQGAQGRSLVADVDGLLEDRELAGTYVYHGVWQPNGATWESLVTIAADGTMDFPTLHQFDPTGAENEVTTNWKGSWRRDPMNADVLHVAVAFVTGSRTWSLNTGTFTFHPTRVGFTASLVNRGCPAGALPCPGPCNEQPASWTMNACRVEP